MNKKEYLAQLKHPKEDRYKRSKTGIIGYMGGKRALVGEILERIPDDICDVCSPFVGGASVEHAIAVYMNKKVHCYDINRPLIIFYNTIKNDKEGLIKSIKKRKDITFLLTRNDKKYKTQAKERLTTILNRIHSYLNGDIELSDVEISTDIFYNLKSSFGGKLLGSPVFKIGRPKKITSHIERINTIDLSNMYFDWVDFEQSIPLNNNNFIYADPPYWLGETSHMKTGLYPGHDEFDHELLYTLLRRHNERFVLSYNDCEYIRDKYSWCRIETPAEYYYGSTTTGKSCKKSKELLIMNY